MVFLTVKTGSTSNPFDFQSDIPELVSTFSIAAGVDLIMALALVWYLHRGATRFDSTNFMATRIIQYTVATGLTSRFMSVGCVIFFFLKPEMFLFMSFHFSLGHMYTNALLAKYSLHTIILES
ncbi:hypothetical protein B0H14DRAFT_3443484 [Mycena olivaceomarginata]|nr:hypothetical protein B0H14DRAFT_3443484 [Mycena olivaceomarginata]